MTRERDLFRAIVLSAVTLVGAPACGGSESAVDAGTRDAATGTDAAVDEDAGTMVADAGDVIDAAAPNDASSADEDAGDAMVLII